MLPKILRPKARLIIPYTIPDSGKLNFKIEAGENVDVLIFEQKYYNDINNICKACYYAKQQKLHCFVLKSKQHNEKYKVVINNMSDNFICVTYEAFEENL